MKKTLLILLLLFVSSLTFGQNGLLFFDGSLLTNNDDFLNYFPVSRTDLTAIYDTAYTNASGDLLNLIVGGANATYISGTDTAAIYDFSGLSDNRLDKSNATYWVASLDDYFYYDVSHPYYSKLKDFHYKYFEAQMASDNNFAFLKAKASTNTSNILASVTSLYIYSVEQTGAALTKLQTHIGIQADFYGDNVIINGDFENDLVEWHVLSTEGTVTITSISHEGSKAALFTRTSGTSFTSMKIYQDAVIISGVYYEFSFYTRGDGTDSGLWSLYDVTNSTYYQNYISTGVAGTSYTKVTFMFVSNGISVRPQFVANNNTNLATIYYDDVECNPFYQNYYAK